MNKRTNTASSEILLKEEDMVLLSEPLNPDLAMSILHPQDSVE